MADHPADMADPSQDPSPASSQDPGPASSPNPRPANSPNPRPANSPNAGPASPEDPGPAPADVKDWTWVLLRPCPQCGFDAAALAPADLPATIEAAGEPFAAALLRSGARERPAPGVWSPMEYACHARDVCAVMADRARLLLDAQPSTADANPSTAADTSTDTSTDTTEPVRFPDWDQNAAAAERQYWRSTPDTVAQQIRQATKDAATVFSQPTGAEWDRQGLRGDGALFTTLTLGRYLTHELRHHLWDVDG